MSANVVDMYTSRPRMIRRRIAIFVSLTALTTVVVADLGPVSAASGATRASVAPRSPTEVPTPAPLPSPACAVPGVDDQCESWTAMFDDQGSHAPGSVDAYAGTNNVTASIVAPDGDRLYMTGQTLGPTGWTGRTVAVDGQTGAELWTAPYTGASTSLTPADIAVSPDGGTVFVIGMSVVHSPREWDTEMVAVAYDAQSGTQLWNAGYQNPGVVAPDPQMNYGVRVGIAPDGSSLFATGWTLTSGTGVDVVVLALDTSDGSRRWVVRRGGAKMDVPTGLDVSHDGSRVFLSGYREPADPNTYDYDWETVALDAEDGDEVWRTDFDSGGEGLVGTYDLTTTQALSPDGATLYVAGHAGNTGTRASYTVIAYDVADGAQQWVGQYKPADLGYNTPFRIAVSANGARIVLTGRGQGGTDTTTTSDYSWDVVTAAFDASDGSLLWGDSYDTLARVEEGNAVAISPDGATVFVAGNAGNGRPDLNQEHGYDAVTLAYDMATGDRRWIARTNTTVDDTIRPASAVVTADGGELFVLATVRYTSKASAQRVAGNAGDAMLLAYDLTSPA